MNWFHNFRYRFGLWAFRWIKDNDGDIGLQLFHFVTLIKYKESTLVYWFHHFEQADKWQGHN